MTETWVPQKMGNADTNLIHLYYIRVSWLGSANKKKEICYPCRIIKAKCSNIQFVGFIIERHGNTGSFFSLFILHIVCVSQAQ